VTNPVILAVDGGNSKTDLALVRSDGALLAHVRGPLSSPHHLGLDACVDLLQGMLDDAVLAAELDRNGAQVAEIAEIFLAGVDFPAEERQLQQAVEARNWAARTTVGNDTFAVLRAGTARGWGVAVVCGAGINCVGVAPDGRHLRFPALGAITGDWGGGYDVGLAALSAAARSEDGRGPATSLERAVPAHFQLRTPLEVAEAIHGGRIANRRLIELAPVVFAEAGDDDVAAAIVERLAAEIVALARVAITRLDLGKEPVEVLLGGGLMRAGDGRLLGAIEADMREVGDQIVVHRTASPPIVGAALFGLDALGAGEEARERIREELEAAVDSDEELVVSDGRGGDG
jgi:N-acetylglucosamine kinase-like BadF-type ATPase